MRDQRDRYLLDDLHAFVEEHDRCGDLDSAVEGDRVWMTCTCGARRCETPIMTDRLVRRTALVRVPTFG